MVERTYVGESISEPFDPEVQACGQKAESSLKLQTTDCFWEKRQECSTLKLHSLTNMLTPKQMALHQPAWYKKFVLQKPLQISTTWQWVKYHSRKKVNNWLKKNFIPKVGLSWFPNNAHEPILLIKEDISQENTKIFKKTFILFYCIFSRGRLAQW